MSFNAREALERIRQSKALQQESQSVQEQPSSVSPFFQEYVEDFRSNVKEISDPGIVISGQFDDLNVLNGSGFDSYQSQPIQEDRTLLKELMKKVQHLEKTTERLSKELSHSQEISTLMRKEKSGLQTQILKLESENRLLKSDQKKKMVNLKQVGEPKGVKDSKHNSNDKMSISKESEDSVVDSNGINDSLHGISKSLVPQQLLQTIIQQPVSKILSKKESNFRALRVNPRLHGCNKQLLELSRILKEYPNMDKPTIEIDISFLTHNDFHQL